MSKQHPNGSHFDLSTTVAYQIPAGLEEAYFAAIEEANRIGPMADDVDCPVCRLMAEHNLEPLEIPMPPAPPSMRARPVTAKPLAAKRIARRERSRRASDARKVQRSARLRRECSA